MTENNNFSPDIAGSVGWLIDRTLNEQREILGTVWVTADKTVTTCAHLVLPYFDFLDALVVELPALGQRYSIRETLFHPDFDRWQAKRELTQDTLHPNLTLALQENNVVVLRLGPPPRPIDQNTLTKANNFLSLPAPEGDDTMMSGQANRGELITHIQTLTNARYVGTLNICDVRNRPIARLFCNDRKLTHARFRDAFNEDAVYRLLTDPGDSYRFYFRSEGAPEWVNFAPIDRQTAAVMMEACRRVEDFNRLLQEFGGERRMVAPKAQSISMDLIPEELLTNCITVWQSVTTPVPLRRILRACNLDGYAVMQALNDLLHTNHLMILDDAPQPAVANSSPPLPMSPKNEFIVGETISSLTIDPDSMQLVFETGTSLGIRRAGDPWRQIHSIALPPEAAGAPILVDGKVVGIQCGLVRENLDQNDMFSTLHQFLWVNSVYPCIGVSETAAMERPELLATGPSTTLTGIASQAQQANVPAPSAVSSREKFTSSNYEMPVFDAQEKVKTGDTNFSSLFKPMSAVFKSVLPGKKQVGNEWMEFEFTRQELSSDRYGKVGPANMFRSGDLIRVQIKMLQDAFLTVLGKSSAAQMAIPIYPDQPNNEKLFKAGEIIVVPEKPVAFGGKFLAPGLSMAPIQGTDLVLFIASKTSLKRMWEQTTPPEVFELLNDMLAQEADFQCVSVPLTEDKRSNDMLYVSRWRIQHMS